MTTATATDPGVRMLRADRHYREALGLSTVPLKGKRPHLPGWQERPLPVELVEEQIRTRSGLGFVHAWSGTATLDADASEDRVALALAAVGVDFRALIEDGTPAIVGNPAKPPKKVYRVPEGYALTRRALGWPKEDDPKGREVVLELRAGLVQDVLPPTIHPDTGEPYTWIPDIPRSREDLPLLPGALLGLWLSWDLLRPLMEAACPWGPQLERGSRDTTRPRTRVPTPNGTTSYTGPSIIEEWNARVPVSVILERNGYERAGDGRWVAPDSTTGDPGVVLLEGRVFSHHASDPLGDGHAHDAFDLLRILEHGGDAKEAARGAARELGMDLDTPARREAQDRANRARAVLNGGPR